MKTNVFRELDTAKDKVRYDEYVKRVLSNKYILAWILKGTTEEFKDYPIDKIALECIEKDIQIGTVPVYPGATNTGVSGASTENKVNQSLHRQPHMIIGDTTENRVPGEGTITYDIRFHATVPGENETIGLIINVEAQQAFYTKYEMVTRAIFYAARMLSAQLDTEFSYSDYDGLKKVYSIFICMNAPAYIGNAISEYKITKHDLFGTMPDKKYSYDKLSVIIVCLNEDKDTNTNKLLHLLNVLMARDMEITKKAAVLTDYGIAIDDSLGKELNEMCNLSEAIEDRGLKRGLEQGLELGRKQGQKAGEQRMSSLIQRLLIDQHPENIQKVVEDEDFREAMYKKYYL